MSLGVFVLIAGMTVIVLIALAFLIWGVRNKQFKDVEEAKYSMLEDKEPQPWPHQEGE